MIIFMGVAGSGKSVQGRMLADRLALPWLSTGEFLRMLVSGDRRKDMISGKLLSDKEIISLVQKMFTIINPHDEFVLDGFPRTAAQADWLIGQIKHGQLHGTAVVHIDISKETAKDRLLSRGRPDDVDESISARFVEYDQTVKPILEQFKNAAVPVYTINGDQDIKKVHEDIASSVTTA
jgi:adenylate kinase